MMRNKKIYASAIIVILFIAFGIFFTKNKLRETQPTNSTSLIPISDLSSLSCDEILNLVNVEHNKVDYSCKKDSDCIYGNTGWCGSCVSKDSDMKPIENLFNIYKVGSEKDCLPQFECRIIQCNKCENNKCVKSYVE